MQPVREVYSLLMPVHDGRVILPRAAIAEVTGYTRPKDRPDDAPEFVLGFIDWQGQKIPLVSFEAARGQPVPELGRRTRIAVLFGIAERLEPNVFAVVTQGYPYLVRVNENVLQHEALEADEPLVLARVRMANEKPYIPDLEKLEVMIAEGLGVQGRVADDEASRDVVDELESFDAGEEDDFDASILAGEGDAADIVQDEGPSASTDSDDTLAGIEPGDVNLDEVTAFGAETDYSAELGELSEALDDDGSESAGGEEDDAAVDLSAFDIEGDDQGESGEIDFSDIEIDFDEEEEDKRGD